MKSRKNTKPVPDETQVQNTPDETPEAVSAGATENTPNDAPEAVTPEDAAIVPDIVAEDENSQVVTVPEEMPKASDAVDVPYSRLSRTGKYLTLLDMYDGEYPKASKMNEFLACLRPLVFELQLSENIKDNKELRANVMLPGGAKGFKALQASIKHLEARVNELYEDIFKDELFDATVAKQE